MIYLTSDLHFGHENILEYCSKTRPFKTIEEHDETLVSNWNSVVKPDDVVWLLGDVAMGDRDKAINYVRRLNGQINLIHGNHDKVILKKPKFLELLNWHGPYKEISVKFEDGLKKKIVLCHFPLEIWNGRHHGAWHCFGHTHGNLDSPEYQPRVDVGVDVWNFKPVSIDQIRKHMNKKKLKPLDHHGK